MIIKAAVGATRELDVPVPQQPSQAEFVSSANHLPGLDGLRGIAILLVLLFHFTLRAQCHTGLGGVVIRLCSSGWCGVDLFFVLSGFLITGILIDSRGSQYFFRNFYARRTLRIFPLYYGVLLATFVLLPVSQHLLRRPMDQTSGSVWLWTYTVNFPLSFFPQSMPQHSRFDFGHFWSLAVEEQFYLVWPLVIWWCGSLRRIGLICIVVIFVGIGSRFALFTLWGNSSPDFFTIYRAPQLCAGALTAAAIRTPQGWRFFEMWARRIAVLSGIALFIVFLAARSFGVLDKAVEHALFALFFGSVVGMVAVSESHSRVNLIAGNTVLRFLGRYSYGLYVYHMMFLPIFERMYDRARVSFHTPPLMGDLLFIAFATVASLCLAYPSWHLYEKPILRLKRYFPSGAGSLPEWKPAAKCLL